MHRHFIKFDICVKFCWKRENQKVIPVFIMWCSFEFRPMMLNFCMKLTMRIVSRIVELILTIPANSNNGPHACWPQSVAGFLKGPQHIITLRPRRNWHFADDIFKCIFLNENVWIPIKISMKFVPKGPINNTPYSVQATSHYLNQWWWV